MLNRGFKTILATLLLANVLTVPTASAETQSYVVGDKGPSGGTIAYIDEFDQFSWDYIEAAPANWMGDKSATTTVRWSPFGSNASSLTGLGSAIGDGAKNTTDILNTFGNGWGIKSAVRDVNNCQSSSGIKYCNVTITLDTNHGVTRFDTTQYPVMPIFCEGVYLDSFTGSLTGEMKVVSANSFSFVENGYQLKLAEQINAGKNCKITYAAALAASANIGGNTGWVLPSYDELAQVQRAVGTNNQSPYAIDQSILTKNGYTASYYSTSSLRDPSNQRVWGFTNASVAGKGGSISLLYGAAVLPIRYFKTTVPVRNKDLVGEENATAGPTEITAQILQTDTNWYAKSSPIKVTGSIQIPANVTLKIHPGAVVDFTNANVTLLGKIVIGSNSSPLVTKVKLANDFIAKGNGGQLVIENSEILGQGGTLLSWGASLSNFSMDNSTISKFRLLIEGATKISISNSIVKEVDALTSEFAMIYDFLLSNNVLYEMKNLFVPSKGIYFNDGGPRPTTVFKGNLILNTVNRLNFVIPSTSDSVPTISFENNRFESPKLLNISGGTKAGGNYWGTPDETTLRAQAKITDGRSDITLATINFTPFLSSPPAAPAKYQGFAELIAAEKLAADKAAKAKETSDKLQSNVACALTPTGARYDSTFVNAASAAEVKNITFNWQYALLKAGENPGSRSNFGEAAFIRTTPTAALDITYEDLLKLAGGTASATILVLSTPSTTVDSSVVTNTLGRGCYIDLPSILSNKLAAEKVAADKAAAEAKAIADKAAADAKAAADKIAAEKLAADKLAASLAAKSKSTTITCVKGKVTKKVTGIKPVCPSGYKKK